MLVINWVWFICDDDCCCFSCCWSWSKIELIGFNLPACGWYFNGLAILAFTSNDLRLIKALVAAAVVDVFKLLLLFVIVVNCCLFMFGCLFNAVGVFNNNDDDDDVGGVDNVFYFVCLF